MMKGRLNLKPLIFIPVAAVLLFEAALRLSAGFLPMPARNLLLTGYRESPAGIYSWNPRLEIPVMKPEFRRRMFFNGGEWEHRTNGLGLRDDGEIEAADIIVLGDSMVYGHMVEVEETLAVKLEEMSGLTVANLGVQGDYPPSQYLRMKYLGLYLRPETVLFFINDWQDEEDFTARRPSRGDIDRIIEAPLPDYSRGLAEPERMDYHLVREPGLAGWLGDSHAWRTWKYLRKLTGETAARYRGAGEAALRKYRDEARDHLGRILLAAERSCRSSGARLVVVTHHLPSRRNDAHSFKEWCLEFCREQGIPCLDLKDSSPRKAYYIKDDGHYTPEGHTWVARSVSEYLGGPALPAPAGGESP